MSESIKIKPFLDLGRAAPESASSAAHFSSFVAFIYRRYRAILFCLFLTIAFAAVYVSTTPPSYTAAASMMVDSRKVQVFQQQPIIGDLPADTELVETEVEVLKSENIALAVIKDLHLTADPEFVGPSSGLLGAVFRSVANLFGSQGPSSEFELTRRAVTAFQSRLDVKRIGLTYVIQISFRSLSPDRAAQIANAVADAYIVDQLDAKFQATRRASAWLQDRIKELREQASTAERAVVEFKNKNGIVNAGGRLINEQQIAELNSELVIAQAQSGDSKARLDRIEAVLRNDSPDVTANATVADTLTNEVITKLRSQYLELAGREADWAARYGNDHLAVVNLRTQMGDIRNSILDELRRIAETYKSNLDIAEQREQSVQKQLAQVISASHTTNEAQVTAGELQSNAETYRALYDNFLQRYMESVQQQSFPITDARVISFATRPLSNSHPRTNVIFAGATFVGIVMGLGIALLQELSDQVFRTIGQVETLLQTSCIAVVPFVKQGRKAEKSNKRSEVGSSDCGASAFRIIVPNQSVAWNVVDAPLSRFSEAIRSIKLAVDLEVTIKSSSTKSGIAKVLGVTSALPNEGKSTIATAVALLAAATGERVILLDCDLRNPSLSRSLAARARSGIVDVLSGKAQLEDVIWTERSSQLKFLPGAVGSRLVHTNEMLGSPAMKKLFDQLRLSFAYIVVDLPPIAPIVDVRSTTDIVDSYTLVIEWGRTRTDVVEHAFNVAKGIREKLLGVVLNKTDTNRMVQYDGLAKYHYNEYYGRYGYMD
jgi:succinoglycan biosynthesis transport protein ExoP